MSIPLIFIDIDLHINNIFKKKICFKMTVLYLRSSIYSTFKTVNLNVRSWFLMISYWWLLGYSNRRKAELSPFNLFATKKYWKYFKHKINKAKKIIGRVEQ